MRKFYLYLDDLRDTPWWFDRRVKSYVEFVELKTVMIVQSGW